MNIAICDDEENVRVYVRALIQKQKVPCSIVEFASGKEALQFLNRTDTKAIDILFLDISMKEVDGMDVAKQLRGRMEEKKEAVWGSLPLLIFMTGYPQYMAQAFSVNAFQFILKPIRESEFKRVFAQAQREYRYLTADRRDRSREILVKNGNTTRSVRADEVFYIESSNRKVILYMPGDQVAYYGKIGELELALKPDFFRIHKGYLINMKYVARYSRSEVQMKNGDSLLISKYKYQDFVKSYLEYISEGR